MSDVHSFSLRRRGEGAERSEADEGLQTSQQHGSRRDAAKPLIRPSGTFSPPARGEGGRA